MNMFKKNGGFTLVELIVVIAILAILAGVAVPAYSGYINSANKAADVTVCDAVKTAAMAALATKGEVTKVEITSGTTPAVVATVGTNTYSLLTDIANETADDDFKTYFGSTAIAAFKTLNASKATATKATWESTGANAGQWIFS